MTATAAALQRGYEPNGTSSSVQTLTVHNHPEVLQKVLLTFKVEGIDYLLKYKTTDTENGVYICRREAKKRAATSGKIKIDVLRALHAKEDGDELKKSIGEAQLQADTTRARQLFKETLHMQDVQGLGLTTGEISEGFERIRNFPFQGMSRFDVKAKLKTNEEDAVKDIPQMLKNHHEYLRRVELRVSYSTIVLAEEEKLAEQRQMEIVHSIVHHMPKEFEGAHQMMQQKFQALQGNEKITFVVLKAAMQQCASRAHMLKRQEDQRQTIEETQEKSVVPDKVDNLHQALITTIQQLPSKLQAMVTSNNAFHDRQNKGGGSNWQGAGNGNGQGGGRTREDGPKRPKCYVCDKPGHFARDCKHKKKFDEAVAKARAGFSE